MKIRKDRMIDSSFSVEKKENDIIIALAGNPNVGKSTVFNALTGLNQHTGNWPGKTVTNAWGRYNYNDKNCIIVDLPGTYSLLAHSSEEEVARDFICFSSPTAVIVVCDATNIERNMNLVLQTLEITSNVVMCLNLMDEAKKKKISINLDELSKRLGVPVIPTNARSNIGLDKLMDAIFNLKNDEKVYKINYTEIIEGAINSLEGILSKKLDAKLNTRFVALKLLDYDELLINKLNNYLGYNILDDEEISNKLLEIKLLFEENNVSKEKLSDDIVTSIVNQASEICDGCITYKKKDYNGRDRKIDKFLTNKWTGIPVMILLLTIVFWITIVGANYPSKILADIFFYIEDRLIDFFIFIKVPPFIYNMLVLGVYRVLAWVVSVMLPPMAIFFPLFTLLEDVGYLPRIAFNLDKIFKKCRACGKQALTMCVGFGCNAVGVAGARIIDSPRERLIAIITNNFVPCNGRFPTLIAIISMFFISNITLGFESVLFLILIILLGIIMTFIVSKLLSITILKGIPSSFVLELPPYRRPQIGKVIVRSIMDRTLFVLGRAVVVAIPAGLIIWLLSNISIGSMTLLTYCSNFLNPFATLIGLDGVILLAFILGFPANEIVIPIIIMAYMATGSLIDISNLLELKVLFVSHGWTWITAISVMLFSLMHWPCSTTCLTIKKETGSWKWTFVSFLVPTICGILICFIFTTVARMFV